MSRSSASFRRRIESHASPKCRPTFMTMTRGGTTICFAAPYLVISARDDRKRPSHSQLLPGCCTEGRARIRWRPERANFRRKNGADGQTRTADRRFTKSHEVSATLAFVARLAPRRIAPHRPLTLALLHELLHGGVGRDGCGGSSAGVGP